MPNSHKFKTVDEYIKSFPTEIQPRLKEMRKIILDTVPNAEEYIGYNIPAYRLNGRPLVYFSANKQHIGFYPMPSGVAEFEQITGKYSKSGKGTIRFLYSEPLSVDLIKKIVKFRVNENDPS